MMNNTSSTPPQNVPRDFDPDDPPRFGEWVRVDREPQGVQPPHPVTAAPATGNSRRMIAGFGILLALAALIAVMAINPFRHPTGKGKGASTTTQAPGGGAALPSKSERVAPSSVIMDDAPGDGVNGGDHARTTRKDHPRHLNSYPYGGKRATKPTRASPTGGAAVPSEVTKPTPTSPAGGATGPSEVTKPSHAPSAGGAAEPSGTTKPPHASPIGGAGTAPKQSAPGT